jgi:hypothetical protein
MLDGRSLEVELENPDLITSLHVGNITFDICLDRGELEAINKLRTNISDLFIYGSCIGTLLDPLNSSVVDETLRFNQDSIPQITRIEEDDVRIETDRDSHFKPIFRPFLWPEWLVFERADEEDEEEGFVPWSEGESSSEGGDDDEYEGYL